jgi:hypothetical protein
MLLFAARAYGRVWNHEPLSCKGMEDSVPSVQDVEPSYQYRSARPRSMCPTNLRIRLCIQRPMPWREYNPHGIGAKPISLDRYPFCRRNGYAKHPAVMGQAGPGNRWKDWYKLGRPEWLSTIARFLALLSPEGSKGPKNGQEIQAILPLFGRPSTNQFGKTLVFPRLSYLCFPDLFRIISALSHRKGSARDPLPFPPAPRRSPLTWVYLLPRSIPSNLPESTKSFRPPCKKAQSAFPIVFLSVSG